MTVIAKPTKFTIIKTITVTTKELYEVEMAGWLDPLNYIGDKEPIARNKERDVKVDIFREGELDE